MKTMLKYDVMAFCMIAICLKTDDGLLKLLFFFTNMQQHLMIDDFVEINFLFKSLSSSLLQF